VRHNLVAILLGQMPAPPLPIFWIRRARQHPLPHNRRPPPALRRLGQRPLPPRLIPTRPVEPGCSASSRIRSPYLASMDGTMFSWSSSQAPLGFPPMHLLSLSLSLSLSSRQAKGAL